MEQSPYNTPEIIGNEPRMAVLFLIDTSGSMSGAWIQALNEGMNKFKEAVCMDEKAKRVLDVAIVRFDRDYGILQPFTPIEHMIHMDLSAKGSSTIYSPAIREALRMVDERRKLYINATGQCYKPWILFITDGEPHDDISDIADEIKGKMESGKVSFRSLAVGQGWQAESLHLLSKFVLRLEEQDFTDYFDWIHKSMAHVSQSSPGDKLQEVKLNQGGSVTVDRYDTSIFNGL